MKIKGRFVRIDGGVHGVRQTGGARHSGPRLLLGDMGSSSHILYYLMRVKHRRLNVSLAHDMSGGIST